MRAFRLLDACFIAPALGTFLTYFTYALHANDVESGRLYFLVDHLDADSQSDDRAIDYGIHLCVDGQSLWYKKNSWSKNKYANMGLPNWQRKHGLQIALPGADNYFLKNTDVGIDIGGFIFNDEFQGLIPLWNAQTVTCKDRAYRLIFQYTGLRKGGVE